MLSKESIGMKSLLFQFELCHLLSPLDAHKALT